MAGPGGASDLRIFAHRLASLRALRHARLCCQAEKSLEAISNPGT